LKSAKSTPIAAEPLAIGRYSLLPFNYNQIAFVYQLQVVALGKHLCGSSSSMVMISPFSVTISVLQAKAYLFSLDGINKFQNS